MKPPFSRYWFRHSTKIFDARIMKCPKIFQEQLEAQITGLSSPWSRLVAFDSLGVLFPAACVVATW
jgi:hypothetical protein